MHGELPILVEVWRGTLVESTHRGAAVVVDVDGQIVAQWGDPTLPIYARSAIKPIQALPLVESGAAVRYGLADRELALACASHHGEAAHVQAVAAWLGWLGLAPADLECGAHLPYDIPSAHALLRSGAPATALHNNCSGKHAGFLSTARHLGEDTRGYIDREHPIQRRIAQAIAEMTDTDVGSMPEGVDGCGIPVIGLPLRALALGMARLSAPASLGPARAAACGRIAAAMMAQPFMVDGTAGFPTLAMTAGRGTILVKPGAEGVYAGALPARGLGFAVKIADGAARAAEVTAGAVLEQLGAFREHDSPDLAALRRPILRNVAGRVVGELRPALPSH